jgi:hypothetical protein
MYECINNLPDNVYINPTIINKRLYHGSIAQGIYSNMVYALQHFKFNYFLVCSSRNFFENNLTIEKLNNLIYIKHFSKIQIRKLQYTNHSYNDWLWPHLSKSLLFQYIISKNEKLYNTPHEGLLFKYTDTLIIKRFLDEHVDIRENTFKFEGCMEEFALQTIAYYKGGGCYNLGNGSCIERSNGPSDTKFCYKVKRE